MLVSSRAMDSRRIFGREARQAAWHNVEQALILVLSALAIAVVNLGDDYWRFWGNVVGLCASPFWILSGLRAQPMQWGQLTLSVVYAVIWCAGVVKYA